MTPEAKCINMKYKPTLQIVKLNMETLDCIDWVLYRKVTAGTETSNQEEEKIRRRDDVDRSDMGHPGELQKDRNEDHLYTGGDVYKLPAENSEEPNVQWIKKEIFSVSIQQEAYGVAKEKKASRGEIKMRRKDKRDGSPEELEGRVSTVQGD